jgi:hypothetical protein
MMSHLDPEKGSQSPPCLRSKKNPPKEVKSVLDPEDMADREAW